MDSKQWLDRLTGGASVNSAAQRAEVPQKTLDTQLRSRAGLKPEMAVRIARAYGVSPVAALAELGFISQREAQDSAGVGDMLVTAALARATDDQILEEIGRRLDERRDDNGTVTPIDRPKPRGPKSPGVQTSAARPKDKD